MSRIHARACAPFALTAATLVLSGAMQAPSQQQEAGERFAAVQRYWEWSRYWSPDGLDFPGTVYWPGKAFRALVFYTNDEAHHTPFWGFCSKELGICQAYSAWQDRSVYRANSMRLQKGETETRAILRFQRTGFVSDQEFKASRAWLGLAPSKEDDVDPLETVQQTIHLPALDVPQAIRRKIENQDVENWVRSMPPGDCTVIVPYSDDRAPMVPVLFLCPQESGVQFLTKYWDHWAPTAGGWFQQKKMLQVFAPRIKKYASLILNPSAP